MTALDTLCHAEQSQLLMIDIQQRLVDAMPGEIVESVVAHSSRLLQAAVELSIPILHSEQYPKGLGATLEKLSPQLTTEAIEKTHFSCCGVEQFTSELDRVNRPQVIIMGMESHVCVLQTALELQASGKQVYVVEDAVCSRRKQHHQNALKRLAQQGVIITNHESVMFEWLRDAKHESFKSLSKLIR